MKLTGNDLKQIGFNEGKALGLALDLIEHEYQHLTFDEKLTLLRKILDNPASYLNDAALVPLVKELMPASDDTVALQAEGKHYEIYGAAGIEQGALNQMQTAMRLPVTVA